MKLPVQLLFFFVRSVFGLRFSSLDLDSRHLALKGSPAELLCFWSYVLYMFRESKNTESPKNRSPAKTPKPSSSKVVYPGSTVILTFVRLCRAAFSPTVCLLGFGIQACIMFSACRLFDVRRLPVSFLWLTPVLMPG